MPETVGEIGEFGLIDRIGRLLREAGSPLSPGTLGMGDDCALFRPRAGRELLVTCDSLVEGRHYLPRFTSPMNLGRRAMAQNISDIGAMGGHPLYALVSLGLKPETPAADVEDLYRGFVEQLNPFGAAIVGGNLTGAEGPGFIDITLMGEVASGRASATWQTIRAANTCRVAKGWARSQSDRLRYRPKTTGRTHRIRGHGGSRSVTAPTIQLCAQWMTVPLVAGPLTEAFLNQLAWATCLP